MDKPPKMASSRATAKYYLAAGLPAPMPSPDGLDRQFWEAARRHEVVVQRCNSCRAFQFGPEWVCHRCHGFELSWHRLSGRGRIYSWERIWHPAHPALKESCPFLVVLVEIPEADNVRMLGNLLGDPMQEPPFGAAVEAVFEDHDEGFTLIQWRVAAGS